MNNTSNHLYTPNLTQNPSLMPSAPSGDEQHDYTLPPPSYHESNQQISAPIPTQNTYPTFRYAHEIEAQQQQQQQYSYQQQQQQPPPPQQQQYSYQQPIATPTYQPPSSSTSFNPYNSQQSPHSQTSLYPTLPQSSGQDNLSPSHSTSQSNPNNIPPQPQQPKQQVHHRIELDPEDEEYDPFNDLFEQMQIQNGTTTSTMSKPNGTDDDFDFSLYLQQQEQLQQQQQTPTNLYTHATSIITPKAITSTTSTSNPKSPELIDDMDPNTLIACGQIIVPIDEFDCGVCCESICPEIFHHELQTIGCFAGNLKEFRDQCPALQFTTCLHQFCLQCIQTHVNEYISSQLTQADVKRIPCLECKEWITQHELQVILTGQQYAKFEQMQFEWSLISNPNMYKCISANCPNIIEKTGALIGDERTGYFNPKFICQQCNVAQCVKCKEPWHFNLTCKEHQTKVAEKAALAGSDLLRNAKSASDSNVKQCPSCKMQLIKESGCSKMKCLCGYGFCWDCGSPGAKCSCTGSQHVFFDNKTGRGTRDITNQRQ